MGENSRTTPLLPGLEPYRSRGCATYFGIEAPAASTLSITRSRGGHTRRVFDGLADTTGRSVTVRTSTWESNPTAPGGGRGKVVKIPTRLTIGTGPSARVREVTLRFPSNAVVGAINKWLFTKIDALNDRTTLNIRGKNMWLSLLRQGISTLVMVAPPHLRLN
jgi:hypothetical protein